MKFGPGPEVDDRFDSGDAGWERVESQGIRGFSASRS